MSQRAATATPVVRRDQFGRELRVSVHKLIDWAGAIGLGAWVPGSDLRKVALAKLVRKRTTVPLGWVAQRPEMGSAANTGHYVRNRKWGKILKRVPKELQSYLRGPGGWSQETERYDYTHWTPVPSWRAPRRTIQREGGEAV